MTNYSVFLQYDDVDHIYVASIPELPGCMAHGKTREQAIREIGVACDLWIETASEMGIDIPEPSLYSTTKY
ncbi:MAG: type II toxin-antitoxin system HicB family antitoxin [Clostridiales bacterium]|nr:type II toxin-antitoxin system HicB family antitoxin [Clostridiales bacterium]